jgi:hypothetical protein
MALCLSFDAVHSRAVNLAANARHHVTVPAAAIALALMLALAAPAQALNKEEWGFARSGEMVQVSYGIQESDVGVTIIFRCEGKPKRIEIISTVLPPKPRKGQSVKTTLSNGKATAAYDGKFGRDKGEEGGFYFQAIAAADPKVVEILKSGTTLTIGIPGQQQRVPLRGVAKPLAQFEKACFGR